VVDFAFAVQPHGHSDAEYDTKKRAATLPRAILLHSRLYIDFFLHFHER